MKKPPKIAVCSECGHTWKPYNTATSNHKRRCSKCGSYAVEIRDPEPKPEPDTPPAVEEKQPEPKPEKTEAEELAAYINTKPEPKKREEAADPTKAKTPKIKSSTLIIAFIVLAAGALLGASWYFHRGRPPMDKVQHNKPQSETPEEPPRRTKRIIGL